MLNKRNIILFGYIISFCAIICTLIYSINKGFSNTDECTTAIQLANKNELLQLDLYNIIDIISKITTGNSTLLSLRYSKIIFIGLSLIINTFLWFHILVSKQRENLHYFISLIFFWSIAAITTVFNRALHYNDIMDHTAILCISILIFIKKTHTNAIEKIILSSLYAISLFLLFCIKFPTAILLLIVFYFTIIKIKTLTKTEKILSICIQTITLSCLIYIYLKSYYAPISDVLIGYQLLSKIMTKLSIPFYSIDAIFFACAFVFIFIIINYKRHALQITKSTIYPYLFFIGTLLLLLVIYSNMHENDIYYLLYYLLPAIIICLYFMFVVYGNVYYKIKNNQKENIYWISILLLLLVLNISGSYTLQIINLTLHPFFIAFIIGYILYFKKKWKQLHFVNKYVIFFFILFNVLNPFLYSSTSIFQHRTPLNIPKTNETIFVNKELYQFYTTINQETKHLSKQEYVINIDHSNVLYFIGLKPYLVTNIVDEQAVEIYKKQLEVIGNYIQPKQKPSILIASKNIPNKFTEVINSQLKMKKKSCLIQLKNPMQNIFKNNKSKGEICIFTLNN